jgi:hypothetical protein
MTHFPSTRDFGCEPQNSTPQTLDSREEQNSKEQPLRPSSRRDQAARFISVQFRQEHLKSGFSGIAVWPHSKHRNHPSGRGNIGSKSPPSTQYGHRAIWSSISAFRSLAPRGEPRATLASFNLIFYPYSGYWSAADQSGNSIRSGCFLSRSCSSASTFSRSLTLRNDFSIGALPALCHPHRHEIAPSCA